MYLFLHRKDLRARQLRAFAALKKRAMPGLHALILDPALLDERLTAPGGGTFLAAAARLVREYEAGGQTLQLLYGPPQEVVGALLEAHPISGIVAHRDDTPYARRRDEAIAEVAQRHDVPWVLLDDASLAELDDFQRSTGRDEPYKVFTPFYRKWQAYLHAHYAPAAEVGVEALDTVGAPDAAVARRYAPPRAVADALADAAREATGPEEDLAQFISSGRLHRYAGHRDDFANEQATSRLSRHLNTGALAVKTVYEAVQNERGAEAWVRQLAWRDFYLYQARYHEDFFHYERRYDLSRLSDRHYEAWERGTTGIPIVDAAMKQIAETGEMPNRLRMVSAMFLTKNLLCPFTLGEQYFRRQLADYDNAQNRGGWLWSASLGYDASPYFRVMNPQTQSARYDPSGTYIRRWLPELRDLSDRDIHRPRPDAIVDLKDSRQWAIEVYKDILR
ncbi:deoxyribodipyrimidine photo-lyase [Paenibacillus sp. IB182496]|uniref:Deoxyribodipyrimidine photo-lyase n=2 Tax=Paenibacillus sabuli TaxID=2772509 RepID=A0A927GSD0_9BACL|nr:deoxyribodipyrimidine photo-lyase [Paenibacillus sabuli]